MNMVAFDLGGSGGKLLLGRFDGKTLRVENLRRFDNRPAAMGGGLYWDIIDIYRQLCLGLRGAGAAADIHSLGIDSFSNDFGLISRSGELLSQVRCYRDDRTVRYGERIYRRMSPRRLYELTGNQNARFNTLMQLGAMVEAGQGYLLEGAHKLLFTPDLLIHFLTGETVAEYTMASVSQLFRFADGDWCGEILAAFGLRRELFGTLTMPGDQVGGLRPGLGEELGLGNPRVISVCEHDTASAYLAAVCGGDTAIISSGTWALMGCEVPAPVICGEGLRHNVANEGGYPGHHRLLRNVMGSWIIQEIRADCRAAGEDYTFAQLEAAAEQAPAFAFPIDVDDGRFFSPGAMRKKIRGYCRERYGKAPDTVGGLARCVCEGLAMKYRWTLDILERLTGKTLPTVNIVGGGARDSLLCRFTAAACGRPVAAGPEEATGLGNLLVQLIAAGELSGIAQGRRMLAESFPVRWYQPEDTARWEEEYLRYREIFMENTNE